MSEWLANLKIENGIPIPPRGIKRSELKVLLDLAPGQSFVVPTSQARQACLMFGWRNGIKVTTRKIVGQGWRVWVISN